MSSRSTDTEDKFRFRSDRIVCENGLFYFATREGSLEGPYKSRYQAETAVALYIRYHLDPTHVESELHPPDPQFHRYDDRRETERRLNERRQAEQRDLNRK